MVSEIFRIEYKDPETAPAVDLSSCSGAGIQLVTDTVNAGKDEKRALLWQADRSASIGKPIFSNWEKYSHLRFSIYSDRAYGNQLQFRINTENVAGTKMAPYYRFTFTLNWSGWKDFCVKFDDMSENYSPNRSNVIGIDLDCSGWGLTPLPGCKVCFGEFTLVSTVREIVPSPEGCGREIFDRVKDRWRALILGTEAVNLSGSASMKRQIAFREERCEANLYSFRETVDLDRRDSLWGVEIVQGRAGDEYKTMNLYSRCYSLFEAYGTAGSKFYHDPQLLSDCKTALEYLYRYYYGENMIKEGKYGNWWEWDIGIPMTLTKMLLIIENELSPGDIKRYLSPFDHLDYYPRMTAANKTWITYNCLASAVLQCDAERIVISKDMFKDVFDYVEQGDGFYRDGSFIQHGRHPYAGGYALSMMSTLSEMCYAFSGSMFEICEGGAANQYAWIFDTYLPIMHKGNLFANNRGREVSRITSETAAGNSAIGSMVKMIHYAPDEIAGRLEALVKKHIVTCGRDLSLIVPILFADYVAGLASDSEGANTEYNVTKVFGKMDRVTHHNGRYAAAVSMNSDRIWKYEAINLENRNAWYHGDGMIYIYAKGFDYGHRFFRGVDPYRIPGVTCTDQVRVEENIRGGIFNGSAFAGGVSCGEYGIAAMELSPSENPYFVPDLYVKKSYFFLGDEIVALGSGITDTSGARTYTVIENKNFAPDDRFTVDGENVGDISADTSFDTVNRLYFSGMGGYVFPEKTEVYARIADAVNGAKSPNYTNFYQDRNSRNSENENRFLQIWTDHGYNPENAGYCYAYLPDADETEVAAYNFADSVTVIRRDEKVHAVRKASFGIEGYVFFEPDTVGGVSASEPCAVMLKKSGDEVSVFIGNPTMKQGEITVTVRAREGVKVTAGDGAEVVNNGETWRITASFV